MDKELKVAQAKALLWELCYMLATDQWHVQDFNPDTIKRLRAALRLWQFKEGGA